MRAKTELAKYCPIIIKTITLIAKKPIWWIILMFIPLVNFGAAIMLNIALSESFGKGAGFGVGLTLLPFIFAPLLAFGDAEYVSD